MVHLHSGILCSSLKRKEFLPFMTAWMELGTIMLSDISQPVKTHIPYDLNYKWNLMSKIESEA